MLMGRSIGHRLAKWISISTHAMFHTTIFTITSNSIIPSHAASLSATVADIDGNGTTDLQIIGAVDAPVLVRRFEL